MSKALPFVIGTVVVVAAASTGVAWYTGTQVEPVLRQQLAEANQQIKLALTGYPVTAQLELASFDRRLFTSTAHYVATIQGADLNSGQPVRVEAVDQIEHGPFPWSRIKQLKLLPVMASSNAGVVATPELVEWLGVPAEQQFMKVNTTASYAGTLESHLQLVPGQVQGPRGTLRFSGLDGTVKGTQDGKKMELDARVDSLEYTAADAQAPVTMQVNGLNLHMGGVKGEAGFYLGNKLAQADTWRFSGPGRLPLELNKPAILGGIEELDGKLKASAEYRFEQATIGDKPIGSAQMRIQMDNLDIPASRDLVAFYQKALAAPAKGATHDGMELQPQLTPEQRAQADAILGRLLDGHPRFELQPLALKTTNGESRLTFALDMAKPADDLTVPAQLAEQAIRRLDAKLTLAKGTIRDLATLKAQLEGQTDLPTLAQNANGAAEMVATLATLQGLAKLEGEDIVTALHYEGGNVDFNGQKMTVEQFTAFLMGAFGRG